MNQDIAHMLDSKKKYLMVVGGVVLLIAIVFLAFYGYTYFVKNSKKVSPVTLLKEKPEVAELIAKESSANSKEVFTKLDALSKEEKDKAQAESLKLYAASSLMKIDPNAGIDYYVGIANDLDNTPIVRAYAMTKVSQYAVGGADMALLIKVFFKDPNEVKKLTNPDDVKLAVNKKILEVYPMPLASANVARLELKKNLTKENAQLLRDLYFGHVEAGIKLFSETEGLAHFLPVTYLAMADFYRKSESVGAATTSEVRINYERAYGASLAQGQTDTRQFIMLHYTDYLLSVKLNSDAEVVLKNFLGENLTEVVAKNLQNTKGADYPNLVKYLKISKTPVAKAVLKKIGTFLQ